MNLFEEYIFAQRKYETRRHFLKNCSLALGGIAMGSFLGCEQSGVASQSYSPELHRLPHFIPKAKRVIYMHMAGGPSQLEMFDYKPELDKLNGQDCPPSLLAEKRFAFIQGIPKMLGPQQRFEQAGQSGAYIADILPQLKTVVDEMSIIKSMHTDEFNHAPAQLYIQTGSARVGRPSMGSWVYYGLGTESENLPGFMVLVSGGKNPDAGKNAWGSGFLPSEYQGVQCRNGADPILYVSNPDGLPRDMRARTIEAISKINREQYEEFGDPEILSRIAQYEMAFRMQVSVPDVMDISGEPDYIRKAYGIEEGKVSFANNCLLARRLIEKGVRFVQLYDWGWDAHGTSEFESVGRGIAHKCGQIDQPIAALIKDLKQRGLLEETLVVWGGEFGRTPMMENRGGHTMPFKGRDHHSEAFTVWMAGGGVKRGFSYGETDEIGFYGIRDRVHIHDLQATILHLLGIDHEKFTYHFQGRNFRLTDVHGRVVKEIIA